MDEHKPGITVCVRVKPRDNPKEEYGVSPSDTSVLNTIDVNSKSYDTLSFTNDYIHWSTGDINIDPHYATQQHIYDDIGAPIVDSALKGYNCCVFAYGQTGSGKTYSMIGGVEEAQQGLTPRICKSILQFNTRSDSNDISYTYQVSYMELYLEKVKDLLCPAVNNTNNTNNTNTTSNNNLKVRENPATGPYVEGLSIHDLSTYQELSHLLESGNKNRHVSCTQMNEFSSRSHAVFTLNIKQTRKIKKDEMLVPNPNPNLTPNTNTNPNTKNSDVNVINCKVHLIDLAGSENVKMAQTSGDRLKEGAAINKSLLTLGRVIKALSEATTSNKSTSNSNSNSNSKSNKRSSIGSNTNTNNTNTTTSSNNAGVSRRKSLNNSNSNMNSNSDEDNKKTTNNSTNSNTNSNTSTNVVPYRESVLTFLLRESLGGNSKSSLIATIRPGVKYIEDTLSTLRFASQAGRVVNKPIVIESNPYIKTIDLVR